MIFKTKNELRERLKYLWDLVDKESDVEHLLTELWNDIAETKKSLQTPSDENPVK